MTVIPLVSVEQIVGHLLGDGGLAITNSSVNSYFYFTQTFKRFEYSFFVFASLSFLCEVYPDLQKSVRKGTKISSLRVRTRSYPGFKLLHTLFYHNNGGNNYIKFVSDDLINYLTARALAYWFMDDGAYAVSGYYFHTKGFTFLDVYRLAGMLHYKFNLSITVQSHENRPVIYIKSESKLYFKNLIVKYMHPSMMYKLG